MNENLRKLQLIQLEILKVIDQICRKYDIKYSLYAGTLLGAVRHKGFIPWDDDLDICMERSEYNRFIAAWLKENPSEYILQNKENSPKFSQSFTKIRKNNTTFLQIESERGKYHTGIFVDIFPIDRIPSGKFQRLIFNWRCMKYQLYTREFVPPKSNTLIKIISKIFLITTIFNNREKIRARLLKKITKYDDRSNYDVVGIETMASLKKIFPNNTFDNYIYLEFEDSEFMCFANWDDNLKCKFGNYLELPPENEREWKHHPIILDFEKNI